MDMPTARLSRRQLALVLVVFSGVVGSGVGVWALTRVGYPRLGSLVFLLGYGGMTLLVYLYWIRPLEFSAPRWDDDE
jgi:hypothetical protein